MTFDEAPPRLRTLKSSLPRDLALVLGETHADDATAAELDALEQSVKSALLGAERARKHLRSGRPPSARGRIAAVVFTFAMGAAAGVAGSSAVYYVITPSTPVNHVTSGPSRPAPTAGSTSRPEPSAELRQAEPSSDEAAPLSSPTPREFAHPASRNPAVETSRDASTRPAAGSREEFALLARAQAALAGNPGAALALTSDHERNFPNGALVQERELVAIDALLRLGRRNEALARAARFHQQFPSSVHGRRIDVLLGNGETSSGIRR